ncbi:MAG: flagellar hook-associated protein FlgL [Phycisphaerae bacterium]|nr:flagellar hook-associated protein FlgL [Phycisphaerae bacterium]
MAINAVNLMRVSHNLQSSAMLNTLRRNTLSLFLEQNRLATGSRLNTLSDDPLAAGQALRLTEVLEQQDQVLRNIRHANSFLSASDQAIGEVHDLLIQARTLASDAVNITADQEQRDATAELIKGIINQLVNVGNRKLGDVFLFSGQRTTTMPFSQGTVGIQYLGDTGELTSMVDSNQQAAINVSGVELFGSLSAQIPSQQDLNPSLTLDTRLADLKGTAGLGIRRGMIQVTLSSPAVSFRVDLSRAETVGDVIDLLHSAASAAGLTTGPGGSFNAAINPAGNGLSLTVAAGSVTVSEVGMSFAARDLGLVGTATGTLTGADVQPVLTPQTTVASLFGGAGATLGSILITNGAVSRTVDLSGATTVQDILNTINSSDTGVRACINAAGTGIDIINLTSGGSLSIGEAGGNTAGLLGLRTFHGGTLLSSLNGGRGVGTREGKNDLHIVAADGTAFDVALTGARTVQDVLDRINAAASAAGVAVVASLATQGNGIQLQDNTGGAGVLRVERADLSPALDDLGLSAATALSDTLLVGADPGAIKTDNIFTVLSDLVEALKKGDIQAMTDAGERIGGHLTRVARLNGAVGARAQAINARLQYTEAAVDATKALLSEVKDLDYTEAITRFQLAQTALQANLLSGSRLLQLSLLDFIR